MAGHRRINGWLLLIFGGVALFFGGCSNKLVTALFEKVSLAETDPPIPGDRGKINPDDVRAAAVTLSWEKAADEVVDQTALEYKVVYSQRNNIDTAAEAEKNGTVGIDWTADIASGDVAGLTIVTEYYFNVLVRDIAGNVAAYDMNDDPFETLNDTEPPDPGGNLSIVSGSETTDGFTVSWTKGSDVEDITPPEKLDYLVCVSLDQADVATVEEAVKWPAPSMDFEADIDSKVVTGLLDNVTYYVNVIVRDEVGNKALYEDHENDLPSKTTVKIPRMFWTEQANERIRKSVLDGSPSALDAVNTGSGSFPRAIEVDNDNRKIYWTDVTLKKVQVSDFDGTSIQDVVLNTGTPTGIALDLDLGFIYWVAGNNYKIYKTSMDTRDGDTSTGNYDFISLSTTWWVEDIAYDDVTDKVYWVEWNTTTGEGRIRRADSDGDNIQIVKDEDLNMLTSIDVDPINEQVYWSDTNNSDLVRVGRVQMGVNVSSFTTIITKASAAYWPLSVTIDIPNTMIYWADKYTDRLYRAPTTTTSQDPDSHVISELDLSGADPSGIVIDR